MKFLSYQNNNHEERLGLFINDKIYDLKDSAESFSISFPSTMKCLLAGGEELMALAAQVQDKILSADTVTRVESGQISKMLAPVPHPTSCRDAYAFRQHVATARRNRGVDMIPEFDQYPVFYFTNHNATVGEGELIFEKDHFDKLDFELEAAVVIGKHGKNIPSKDADSYIAGYLIMNDISARTLQMEEMRLNLGPAKGKDFATAIGPWLVTPDELEPFKIETEFGNKYDLRMTASHNGYLISDGNLKDMNWTFAEIIERCSYGVELFPGDVIGSGTVGTGCYLELNGSRTIDAKAKDESYSPIWLKPGDKMELEIKGLGKLTNVFKIAETDWSILEKKKIVEPA